TGSLSNLSRLSIAVTRDTLTLSSATAGIAPPSAVTLSAFGAAMVAALWAFQGWSNMTMVSGEIENPQRNVPRGLIYGMLIVLGVYLLTNFAYFYALSFEEIVTSNSTAYRTALPVAAKAAQSFLGTAGGKLISRAFVVS